MTVCLATSIVLDGDYIVHFGLEGARWRIPLESVQIIGEFTTEGSGEDYFVAFVIDAQGGWFQSPRSAMGLDQLLTQLAGRLGSPIALGSVALGPIALGLGNRASFTSRVSWPVQLAGEEMFEFGADGSRGRATLVNKQRLHPGVVSYMSERRDDNA